MIIIDGLNQHSSNMQQEIENLKVEQIKKVVELRVSHRNVRDCPPAFQIGMPTEFTLHRRFTLQQPPPPDHFSHIRKPQAGNLQATIALLRNMVPLWCTSAGVSQEINFNGRPFPIPPGLFMCSMKNVAMRPSRGKMRQIHRCFPVPTHFAYKVRLCTARVPELQ